nr:hypothetical protein [uncultured Desulfuromusa sp.]
MLLLSELNKFTHSIENSWKKILKPYKKSVDYCWVQEEIANAGAWDYLRPQLRDLIGREPRYIGRKRSASTAVGSNRLHKIEQQQILDKAFATTDED